MRRALPILVATVASLAACGEDAPDSTRVAGDTLTVYASLPAHGADAHAGAAAKRGMRQALAEAGNRAGGRAIRFVPMSSTRRGDERWDPGTVEANADRAAADPTAIAYLGELERGASAVSLPVTNRVPILQVSPTDSLTSLTQTPPGRPRAGPERYYPDGRRTFARLVPPDVEAARRIAAALRRSGVQRLATVTGDGIADHELETMVIALIGDRQPRTVTRLDAPRADDDSKRIAELASELVESEPDAIVFAAANLPRSRAALAAISSRLPGATVIGGPALARLTETSAEWGLSCAQAGVPAGRVLSRPAQRRLEALRRASGSDLGIEALLGYDAMRLTLAAIEEAGPDRLAVAHAALVARRDFTGCR